MLGSSFSKDSRTIKVRGIAENLENVYTPDTVLAELSNCKTTEYDS